MNDTPTWTPNIEDAIRQIIKTAITASGDLKPDALPHLVRAQLTDRVTGEIDIDTHINQILEKMKKSGEI